MRMCSSFILLNFTVALFASNKRNVIPVNPVVIYSLKETPQLNPLHYKYSDPSYSKV